MTTFPYRHFWHIWQYNLIYGNGVLLRNAVRCLKCGDTIESQSRHDYKSCKCGNIAVDGGHDYQRLIGHGLDDSSYQDLSIEGDILYGANQRIPSEDVD